MPETRMVRRRPRRHAPRSALVGPIALLILIALIGVAVYYAVGFPRDVEKTVYPLEYTAYIDRYAAEYQLDPARVAAVIYCESSFRPEAESSAGARGLMQIMPDTGAWIAGKLDERKGYTDDALFDPETNIRYGCWYLGYLEKRFDGDLVKVTAAYHAGDNRVKQWLDDPAYSSDGQTLETIPYDSTRKYVDRVQAAYARYKEIYAHAQA